MALNFLGLARQTPITRFMPGRYVVNPTILAEEADSAVPPRVSTCFSSLRYSVPNMIAQYQFSNGWKTYLKAVPTPTWTIWKNSPSLGRYWNYFIKG